MIVRDQERKGGAAAKRLVLEARNSNGDTPLHCAAGAGNAEMISCLVALANTADVKAFLSMRNRWPASHRRARRRGGASPLYLAIPLGDLEIAEHLLVKTQGSRLSYSGPDGRNVLHAAAIIISRGPALPMLLNWLERLKTAAAQGDQDKNGDTPLHRAVHAGNVALFSCLIRNRQVRLDVANKDGMTPLDLACSLKPPGFQYYLNPRSIIEMTLAYAGAPHGSVRPQLLYEKYIAERDVDGESEKHTQATQVMSIVAVLIATVTFASPFTMPGGYRAEGTPVLAGTGGYAFHAFILADTLAFICSCLATFSLVYAGLPAMDISIRHDYIIFSAALLENAGRSFVPAFGLGFYLVLAPVDRMVAVAACVVISASLLWGNMDAWKITCLAITVRARTGVRPYALRTYAAAISFQILKNFGSLIIIFGLPAIRKWARAASAK
ncbi:hypothetical protein C2845_PM09G00290 [Panicum miliaceum]|uniref:PGG domain-containing protein n=1 Tax=Panicum miliaceum TaxID=4540 RepID=A0A3L6RXV2_PANMI|nr:hypothetical protein C2845_PM09G00290 [Panicum miliaceum]